MTILWRPRLPLLAAAALLCSALPATAQLVGGDLNVSEDELSVEITLSDRKIGIDNCESIANRNFVLNARLSNETVTGHELRLTFSTSSTPCGRETLPNCPPNPIEEGGRICGCIQRGDDARSVGGTMSLVDIVRNPCEQLPNTRTTVYFFSEFFQERASGEDYGKHSSPGEEEQIVLDFQRPSQPPAPPRLSSVDAGIEVSFDEVNDDDVERYEICVREQSASPPTGGDAEAGDLLTNDDLRDGFAEADCRTTSSSPYRFGGLKNNSSYVVVYAAVDDAGNRGPNSEPASATPSRVLNFAEYYADRNGPERGGCRQAADRGPGALGLLFAVPLIALGVRRRRSR